MTEFYDYKYISESQVNQLEQLGDVSDIKTLLFEILNIAKLNISKHSIAVDFHYHNYA